MGKNAPRDVLASRYASDEMVAIWGPINKIVLERDLWIAVMKAQNKDDDVIAAYESVKDQINLERIAERERVLRHDVKARIEEFNRLAGARLGRNVEEIHQGFTSRDLTDNIEQMQIYNSLRLVRDRTVALLARFVGKAKQHATLAICARTHNVPAQVTTLGKRFAMYGEELFGAFLQLETFLDDYAIRGIKGPVGTQQDMIDLLGDRDAAREFEQNLQAEMDWPGMCDSIGQIYPRSLDFAAVSILVRLAAAPANFAKTVRLMAGHELMHEGFGKEQTGSSAMPHKMNSRTCERISGLLAVLNGFLDMISRLPGDQWYEGDVSCSVVRRVAVQGAFMAIDGLFESAMTVLDEMQIYPVMIQREIEQYLPFLSTTSILMDAIKRGVGREEAHKAIKTAALEALRQKRQEGQGDGIQDFLMNLMHDPALGFDRDLPAIEKLTSKIEFGAAEAQALWLYDETKHIFDRYPDAVAYNPAAIL